MDPTLVATGLGIAGKIMGGTPATSAADSVFSTNLQFDNSGWNVSFPGSSISASVDKTTSQGGAGGLSGNMQTYLPYALIFVAGLVAWKMLKK